MSSTVSTWLAIGFIAWGCAMFFLGMVIGSKIAKRYMTARHWNE
jgi:hypothetical protein